MVRKVKEPKEIILECCAGSRNATPFFEGLSDDAFIGYQTAIVKILNSNIELNPKQLFDLIKEMLKNNEI